VTPDVNFGERRPEMTSEKERVPADLEEYIPPGMRSARRIPTKVWAHIWISFASILLLMATLVILAYRIGAESYR
jgi:hypothetical protein